MTAETHTPSPAPTLADQFAAERQRLAESRTDARREYDSILSRAATPQPDDAGRLHVLALELDIDMTSLERDVAHGVEAGQHRQRVAEFAAEADRQQARGEEQRRIADHHAAALEALGGDPAALLRAAQAGVVATAGDPELTACYLRSRGWKLLQLISWSDPTNPTSRLATIQALQTQLRRDTDALRAEVGRRLSEESNRILNAWRSAPPPAVAVA